jgi:hypothetical protein
MQRSYTEKKKEKQEAPQGGDMPKNKKLAHMQAHALTEAAELAQTHALKTQARKHMH